MLVYSIISRGNSCTYWSSCYNWRLLVLYSQQEVLNILISLLLLSQLNLKLCLRGSLQNLQSVPITILLLYKDSYSYFRRELCPPQVLSKSELRKQRESGNTRAFNTISIVSLARAHMKIRFKLIFSISVVHRLVAGKAVS